MSGRVFHRGTRIGLLCLLLCGCKAGDRRIVVEISNVPAGTSELDVWLTVGQREVNRMFTGAELAAVSGGRTSVALAVSPDVSGPVLARVQAIAGSCALAEKSVACDSIEVCSTITIALEGLAGCGADGGMLDGAVDASSDAAVLGDGVRCGVLTCAGSQPICCRSASGGPASCGSDPTCNGRVAISCDGRNDCADACCDLTDQVSCVAGGCGSNPVICGSGADCPGTTPNCCPSRLGLKACVAGSC